jgi:hypothetical protein
VVVGHVREPRHLERALAIVAGAGEHHAPALGELVARHRRPALDRPAARDARRAGVDERRAAGHRGYVPGGGIEVEAARIRADAALRQQSAPALDLVLAGVPRRHAVGLGNAEVRERDQPPRCERQQETRALGAAAVEVHGDVHRAGVAHRRQRRGRDHVVGGAGEAGERRQRRGRREHAVVIGEGLGEGAEGGDGGEEVTEAEGAQHEQDGLGHDATSASR